MTAILKHGGPVLLALLVLAAGCAGPPASVQSTNVASGTADENRSEPTPRATGDGERPANTAGSGEAMGSREGATIAQYARTIPCLFALQEKTAPASEFFSCDPNDPTTYDAWKRRPWVVELDLTAENLGRLGFDAKNMSVVHQVLTWTPNEGIGERFLYCRDYYGAPGTSGPKACFEPTPAMYEQDAIDLWEPVFFEDSPWKSPGIHKIWLEPIPWVSTKWNPTTIVNPNTMQNWNFTLDATFYSPDGAQAAYAAR